MALQISEFGRLAMVAGERAQIALGPPRRVTTLTGSYTVGPGASVIRIAGTGTITWPNIATAEDFAGIEYRGVKPGDTFTVA